MVDSIDGGNAPGTIELRNADNVILARLVLTRPSFYLVGSDLQLAAPTIGYVEVEGTAALGTITDGSGNLVVDELSVGVDITEDETHDFEIVLDTVTFELGKQITIVNAVIEHG